jgi:4-hydroxy-tetrahydrodipicolinate reductase
MAKQRREEIMSAIKIMINGLPGNMARNVAEHAQKDNRLELVKHSLTGPEITDTQCTVDGIDISLILPDRREAAIQEIINEEKAFISVDYTHPTAVVSNVEFYCKYGLPFVLGTTGGDRDTLNKLVTESSIPAVIAPNMGKQIVGFQAMMEWSAAAFPHLFKGYTLDVTESHQQGKADTSGTAKAMVGYFNALGVPYSADEIKKERDPHVQKNQWGVPEDFLGGHGWHTYTLVSEDGTVKFQFTHNVNGRDIYARGTLDAIVFLAAKIEAHERGRVFSMIDVLKGV